MGTQRLAAKRQHLIQNCWWPSESNTHKAKARFKKRQDDVLFFVAGTLAASAKRQQQQHEESPILESRQENDDNCHRLHSAATIETVASMKSSDQVHKDKEFKQQSLDKISHSDYSETNQTINHHQPVRLRSTEDRPCAQACKSRLLLLLLSSPCNYHGEKVLQQQVDYVASIETKVPKTIQSDSSTTKSPAASRLGLMQKKVKLRRLALAVIATILLVLLSSPDRASASSSSAAMLQSDPRPTIYSGQVSFGLLLSAHYTPGVASDLRAAASEPEMETTTANLMPTSSTDSNSSSLESAATTTTAASINIDKPLDSKLIKRSKRQIFEKPRNRKRQQQQQQQLQQSGQQSARQQAACSQVRPNALYAGMGAIWASHQANLVGDSSLAIGTYVYDSCSDLEVGQRQSVRIVANLNAFQQTTCEAPRGSPISLTIAHGDQQLGAIQLLTSFRVPVISTREHFELEEDSDKRLSSEQRKYLFSTAPSSRHLAAGSIRFTKRVVGRSLKAPKLMNQFHRMSSKNGLVVVSNNLPDRFIKHLTTSIPNAVNYELLQTSSPIDQVKSIEILESILGPFSAASGGGGSSFASSGSSVATGRGSDLSSAASVGRPLSRRSQVDDDSPMMMSNSDDSSSSRDESSSSSIEPSRMLSPTILMFITTDEAIDLVTRLRNDLAEVSRYYSLVVATREDISPALRTIFHRGGSRLCSGKAFYTISPKPDEVSEFARYFRDTVQMEGDSSDHPLICEYSKYQAQNKRQLASSLLTELDDVSTEAVIKAVWSAAAAFKLVHRRECGQAMAAAASAAAESKPARRQSSTGGGQQQQQQMAGAQQQQQQAAAMTQTANNNKALTECMIKMNKNMSNLVQRQLKRLDVMINSTGLQALDGFQIRFDEYNELMTNKFSIKYVNKECEILEVGQFSGFKNSALKLDEDAVEKTLESTVPEPWPIRITPPASTTITTATSPQIDGGPSSSASPDSSQSPLGATSGEVDNSLGGGGGSDSGSDERPSGQSSSDGGGGGGDEQLVREPPKRKRSESPTRSSASWLVNRIVLTNGTENRKGTDLPAPAQLGNNGGGLSDFGTNTDEYRPHRSTTNGPSLSQYSGSEPSTEPIATTTAANLPNHPMRKLKPYPTTLSGNDGGLGGLTLRDWLPKEKRLQSGMDSLLMATRATTQAPVSFPSSNNPTALPESGGNTDLDEPPLSRLRLAKLTTAPSSLVAKSKSNSLDTAASSTTEATESLADHVTMPSIAQHTRATGVSDPMDGALLSNAARRRALPFGDSSSVIGGPVPARAESTLRYPNSMLSDSNQPEDHSNYIKEHLSSSPVPLDHPSSRLLERPRLDPNGRIANGVRPLNASTFEQQPHGVRWRLSLHLKWISASWFAMLILGANVCGALLTLYVLTFLLMKNCDGSLDRENQCVRSMHLLAIIVVFFGSTLFIVYPTPGLCLLRNSWHNFALVLIFSSLLLQTMQVRSMRSIGLGGRPNRLNQFLTLMFMVGVQVAFELQRWRYESGSYVDFVQQNFGTHLSDGNNVNKKLLMLNSALSMSHFNPLSSLNDQVAPVSLQLSEKYQNLLHEYCTQSVEDFLQSQFYLWFVLFLLILFSTINRRNKHHHSMTGFGASSSAVVKANISKSKPEKKKKNNNNKKANKKQQQQPQRNHRQLKAQVDSSVQQQFLTSGKLLASQFETNQIVATTPVGKHLMDEQFIGGNSHSTFAASKATNSKTVGNVFAVTLICAPIYFLSVVMHVHGQSLLGMISNDDLISSLTMVLIGFVTLIGIFMPILRTVNKRPPEASTGASATNFRSGDALSDLLEEHQQQPPSSSGGNFVRMRQDGRVETLSSNSSRNSAILQQQLNPNQQQQQQQQHFNSNGTAFAMFPEFAPTGLRRPASLGGDSNSGVGLLLTGSSHGGHRSRPTFGYAKESRKNMGAALANLGPSAADSLRNMTAYQRASSDAEAQQRRNNNHSAASYDLEMAHEETSNNNNNYLHEPRHYAKQSLARRSLAGGSTSGASGGGGGEKRLIMLDVDPCCPRHGVAAAWAHRTGLAPDELEATTKNCHHGPPCGQ